MTGMTDTGATCDGAPVTMVTIADATLSARLLTRGAILHDLRLAGVPHALTLGSPDLAAYEGPLGYFGALVGPVANRISGGTAMIGGQTFTFPRNENDATTLHGGPHGTHARNWRIAARDATSVTFALRLADGDDGFPGNREITARYALTGEGVLELTITATTDADTWINMASHGLWNLDGTGTLAGHRLQIHADRTTPTDATALVTGAVADVTGTGFDYRQPREIGPGTDPVLDHNFCLADGPRAPETAVILTGASGVQMVVETSDPGVQIFEAPDFDGGGATDHDGNAIGPYCGLAIEPQFWPDAPNQPHFPSIALAAGETRAQITRWRFAAPSGS